MRGSWTAYRWVAYRGTSGNMHVPAYTLTCLGGVIIYAHELALWVERGYEVWWE